MSDIDGKALREVNEGYAPLLDRLWPLYPTYLRSGEWNVREGWTGVAHLAHGWYLRCHRGLQAVIRLDEAELSEEAAPIRRSVIEHVVALRWLAKEGDTILTTIAAGHSVGAKKVSAAVAAAGWRSVDVESIDSAVASADAAVTDTANNYLLNFAQRAEKYSDAHTMPGYHAESSKSHACYESAMSYCKLPGQRLVLEPVAHVWQVPFATTHLLEATEAVRQIFDPQPWEEEMGDIFDAWRGVVDRSRKVQGLPAIDSKHGVVTEPAEAP